MARKPYDRICKTEYVKDFDQVFLLDARSVVVYATSKDKNSYLYCTNTTVNERKEIEPGEVIDIPKNCKVVMPGAQYQTFDDYTIDANITLPLLRLVNLTIPDDHLLALPDFLADSPRITADNLRALINERRTRQEHHTVQGTIFFVLFGLIALAIAIYIYGYLKYRNRHNLLSRIHLKDTPWSEQ